MNNFSADIKINNQIYNHTTIPLWSWNDKLEVDELCRQMDEMKKAGIGGVFMHARAGLKTPYMQEEWMSCVKECVKHGKKIGLETWIYDENGWPSGFADGLVPNLGYEYQQKSLKGIIVEQDTVIPENLIGVYRLEKQEIIYSSEEIKIGDLIILESVNRFYIDTFNPEAIKKFLEFTHEKYNAYFPDEMGKGIKGFFTDEPQYANGDIPWSWKLAEYYESEYHCDIIPLLGNLFLNSKTSNRFRWQYYDMVGKKYRECFLKQMYDWCRNHNCELTGHVMAEDTFVSQLSCTGGAMPCYEYFDMPGIDWLGRNITGPMLPLQVGSAAKQFGKEKVITESFALCGWDVSFQELRNIMQWQFLYGVNRLCQHLSAYTIRGLRKRDYPPSLHTQLPWFEKYAIFQNYASRLGTYLSQGKTATNILLISSLHAARAGFGGFDKARASDVSVKFEALSDSLNKMLIPHHYGDETIIKKIGEIRNNKFIVGKMEYDTVIIPPCESLDSTTWDLLDIFSKNNGKIISVSQLPYMSDFMPYRMSQNLQNSIIKVKCASDLKKCISPEVQISSNAKICTEIQMSKSILPDKRELFFFANLTDTDFGICDLKFSSDKFYEGINVQTGICIALNSTEVNNEVIYHVPFGAYESWLIAETHCLKQGKLTEKEQIKFNNYFEVEECTDNAITLDTCEYRTDNRNWQPKLAVVLLQDRLLKQKKSCNVEMKFEVSIDEIEKIGKISLVIETPERFNILINGNPLEFVSQGYYIDKSFIKCNVSNFLKNGNNQIIIKTFFHQENKVFKMMLDETVHEAEKNKLTLDSELESIYLIGDFSVKNKGKINFIGKRAMFTAPDFTIVPRNKEIDIRNITAQGYWFFAGEMRLSQNIKIKKQLGKNYYLKVNKLYAGAASVYINSCYVGDFALVPFELDVTKAIQTGHNKLEIILYSGCRNLLGPHHRTCGESYFVSPMTFTDQKDWSNDQSPYWTDDYCMVYFGLQQD